MKRDFFDDEDRKQEQRDREARIDDTSKQILTILKRTTRSKKIGEAFTSLMEGTYREGDFEITVAEKMAIGVVAKAIESGDVKDIKDICAITGELNQKVEVNAPQLEEYLSKVRGDKF